MNKHFFSTAIQILFCIVFSIVVIIISLGIEQDFSKILSITYWIQVVSQLSSTMVIFNIVYSLDINNRMHEKTSRFYNAYATNRLRIKEIESKKLYDELDNAVNIKNYEILVKKCNHLLHKICTRVSYDDIILSEVSIEEIIIKYKVAEKRKKKFIKLVEKIREGRIKVTHIKSDIFLQDKETSFMKNEDIYDYSNVAYEVKRNVRKGLLFLICSILIAVTSFSFVAPDFWSAILTNFTLFCGATMSGFISSSRSIKQKTALYEKRNQFLHKYLGLTTEYKQ